jgi:hypothetical protein
VFHHKNLIHLVVFMRARLLSLHERISFFALSSFSLFLFCFNRKNKKIFRQRFSLLLVPFQHEIKIQKPLIFQGNNSKSQFDLATRSAVIVLALANNSMYFDHKKKFSFCPIEGFSSCCAPPRAEKVHSKPVIFSQFKPNLEIINYDWNSLSITHFSRC